jgi:hypothetical protein
MCNLVATIDGDGEGTSFMGRYRLLFLIWTVVVLAVVVPWSSFQMHSHWQDVGWVPFVSPPIRLRDVVNRTGFVGGLIP